MKLNYIALAGVIVAAGAMFSSCDDDFTRPPMIEPSGDETAANIGFADFKAQYWGNVEGTPATIGYWETPGEYTYKMSNGEDTTVVYEPGDSIIFRGRICSTDESGNIYKNIIVQNMGDDPQEQCAITFAVNKTKLYESFKYGQEVVVYATGLSIGGYRGLMQFGTVNGTNMSFMDEAVFIEHVKTAPGLPDAKKVLISDATIEELNAGKSDPAFVQKWQSRLIRLSGVRFEEGGKATFAGAQTTNRNLLDANGNKIIVRTSAYADFASDRLPEGEGTVTAILSYFGSDWQLLLLNAASCEGFVNNGGGDTPTPPTPPTPGTETEIASFLDASLTEMPADWTTEDVNLGGLDAVWSWKVYNGNGYLNASAHKEGGAVASEAYCVSPVIDLTGVSDAAANFDHAAKFQTTLRTLCTICVREAGTTAWTKLAIPTWPEAGAWTFANSGNIDLSAYNGKKIQLAFLYGSTDKGADTWEIKNLKVTGKK